MFQNYHVSFKDIDIKFNPDDLEPKIDSQFFNKFSPATDHIDKVIYDRIFKKEAQDYQAVQDFNPLVAMGGFLKKTIEAAKLPTFEADD